MLIHARETTMYHVETIAQDGHRSPINSYPSRGHAINVARTWAQISAYKGAVIHRDGGGSFTVTPTMGALEVERGLANLEKRYAPYADAYRDAGRG